MSSKKIKDIFNGQREELPADFWTKLEPNIPTYNEKRKGFFGFPLLGCIGISAFLGLSIVGILFLLNNEDNIVLPNDIKANSQVENINPSGNNALSSNEIILDSNSATNEISEVENLNEYTLNESQINNTKSKSIALTTGINTRNNKNPLGDNSAEADKTLLSQNKTKNQVLGLDLTAKSEVVLEHFTEKESSKVAQSHLDADLVLLEIKSVPSLQFEPNFENSKALEMDIIPVDKEEVLLDRKGFVELKYNTLFLNRTFDYDNRNSWLSNKVNHEKDFVSHELELSGGLFLNRYVSLKSGLKYTRIQELFDYQTEVINTESFDFMSGERTIKHTNSFSLIDAFVQIGTEVRYQKWTFGLYVGPSFNISMNAKGLGLNSQDKVRPIENSYVGEEVPLYKNAVGLSGTLDLQIQYALENNIDIGFGIGGNKYFNGFLNKEMPMQFYYSGFHVGVSVKYYFLKN